MIAKMLPAQRAVDYIEDGMTVGLGTGSTVFHAIQKLGHRVKEGLNVQAIATSVRTERTARELGIKLISFATAARIDLTIDGADEVDPDWNLIKGGGGALLREKIVAAASRQLIIVVDETKVVSQLGNFPLPVEAVKFGHQVTRVKLEDLGYNPVLRMDGAAPYVTDNGNYIYDCHLGQIENPQVVQATLDKMVGVVDNGLFIGYATKVIVGYHDRRVIQLPAPKGGKK